MLELLAPTLPLGALASARLEPPSPASLIDWAQLYWQLHVAASPPKTVAAKRQDLERFLAFFAREVGHDRIDGWTPAVTRAFQTSLIGTVSARTGELLSAATVNRVLATIRHFGRWVHTQRPLLAGSPLVGVKDRIADPPSWNGLTDRQISRLKAACEQRRHACRRADQDPLLEAAVFLALLGTGLREHELVALDLADYHHRGFHNVKRKGARISKKVAVPQGPRDALDLYIKESRGPAPGPLFLARRKTRLTTRSVAYICERIAAQACAQVPKSEQFDLTPHQLRHTFLKRVADKHGVHVAHTMSGNVSIREVFRYTKPSDQEMQQTAEELFL